MKTWYQIAINSILDTRIYPVETVRKSTYISKWAIHLETVGSICWKQKVEQACIAGWACSPSAEGCKSLSRSIHNFLCHIYDLLFLPLHCPVKLLNRRLQLREDVGSLRTKAWCTRHQCAHIHTLSRGTNERSAAPSLHHPTANRAWSGNEDGNEGIQEYWLVCCVG